MTGAGWILLLLAAAGHPQGADLKATAESARQAWQRHDMTDLVRSSPRVLVQLPGTEPSAPVGREQAAALLTEQLRGYTEVSVEVQNVREVDSGRGVVELSRRYRVKGTSDTRIQRLLLVYGKGSSGWELLEVRVSG